MPPDMDAATLAVPSAPVTVARWTLDFIMRRGLTYAIYLFMIIAPLLTSSNRHAQVFGLLISIVVTTTYLFFQYAYISVFCFGGAAMSLYIVYMVFCETAPEQVKALSSR